MATILCFDDEAGQQLGSVQEYLCQFCKHTVDVVEDLSEAEKKIMDVQYDVLLLDIEFVAEKRKGVAGYEDKEWTRTGVRLIQRIRKGVIEGMTTPTVPIVVITAVVHPPTLKDIEMYGSQNNSFIRVIQKPPRLADIGAAIQDGLMWMQQ